MLIAESFFITSVDRQIMALTRACGCMKDIYSIPLRPWLERNERLTMFEFQHRGFSCLVPTEDHVEQPQILKYEEKDFYTQAFGDNLK